MSSSSDFSRHMRHIRSSVLPFVRRSLRTFVRPSTDTWLFVHLSECSYLHPSLRPSDCPSVCPSVRRSPSVCPSVRPPIRSTVRPSFCPSVPSSVRPSFRPSVRPVCGYSHDERRPVSSTLPEDLPKSWTVVSGSWRALRLVGEEVAGTVSFDAWRSLRPPRSLNRGSFDLDFVSQNRKQEQLPGGGRACSGKSAGGHPLSLHNFCYNKKMLVLHYFDLESQSDGAQHPLWFHSMADIRIRLRARFHHFRNISISHF